MLMHEHVFIISPEMKDNIPEDWGDDETGSTTPSAG